MAQDYDSPRNKDEDEESLQALGQELPEHFQRHGR